MIKINEYFNSNVISLTTDNTEGKATVGVIAPGEYEFGTSCIEIMQLVYGQLTILPKDSKDWGIFRAPASFRIEKGSSFKVKTDEPSAYLCKYL